MEFVELISSIASEHNTRKPSEVMVTVNDLQDSHYCCLTPMHARIAHGLPFIARRFALFQEISTKGLGFTSKREDEIPKNLMAIEERYDEFRRITSDFAAKLTWKKIALQHACMHDSRELMLDLVRKIR